MEQSASSGDAPAVSGHALMVIAVVATVSGVLTGLVGAAFRIFLLQATAARSVVIDWGRQWPLWGWVVPVLLAAALVALAAWLVQRFAPLAAGSGVQHVEAVMRGEAEPAPLAVLPVKFIGGILAIGSGLALGREGPTVQLGATIGTRVAQRAGLCDEDVRLIQGAAAGAGLGVAFNTPLGGIAFVFEELSHRFTPRLVVATLAACAAGVLVSRAILGDSVDFTVVDPPEPDVATVIASVVLGIVLGGLGAAYNQTLIALLDVAAALSRVPVTVRAAIIGGMVGLVAWFEPNLVGGGDPLIQAVLNSQIAMPTMLALLAARWVLGPLSYAAQTPGGLFAPLLVVGAGVVRAPFTGALVVLGMTGTESPLIPILAASVAATIVPQLLHNAPIYDTLRARMPHVNVTTGAAQTR